MNEKLHDAAALKGRTITSIRQVDDERIEIETSDGKRWAMWHCQDCCESVRIRRIIGDMNSLVGSPLIGASEETDSQGWPDDEDRDYEESYTWTTYRFSTDKASVVIRWLGSSNGYYSESVSIDEI